MQTIYIAGPFRAENAWGIEQNVRNAERVGFMVAGAGVFPVIPHANTRFFHGTFPDSFWLEGTLALLDQTKALITVPGWEGSTGTKLEIEHCQKNDYPVFHTIAYGAEGREWCLPSAFIDWIETHAIDCDMGEDCTCGNSR